MKYIHKVSHTWNFLQRSEFIPVQAHHDWTAAELLWHFKYLYVYTPELFYGVGTRFGESNQLVVLETCTYINQHMRENDS